jgi:mannose-1-phosphate guanylyltransferase
MDRPVVALVLAGGTGTRLYPASRTHRPKQLRAFGGDRSLLARTVDRASFADHTYVLTRPDLVEDVREHAPDAAVLAEPAPKDTGPALAYGAARVREQVGDCVLVCLPSDHHVAGEFARTAHRAARVAVDTGGLVTVGVEPTRPETGYGYVEAGADRGNYAPVKRFHEKPDAGTAREYVEGGCYWNAGIFAWTPDVFLEAAADGPLGPVVAALTDQAGTGDADGSVDEAFDAVDPTSVDYAVMEGADDAYVVPADFEWDDLGAWDALDRVRAADANGNVVVGDALALEATDNVVATDGHVSLVGVSDLVVAAYGDRTLVAPKADAQRVRDVVAKLDADGDV